ncbi:P-loop containing nucleoside triphosphate hydrolase protein, partial [Thozetella sp. PMI_491]
RVSHISLPHAPPIAHGIQLISPRTALPDRFGAVFPYPLFNAVQSKCFHTAFKSNDNLVVSAPTGSGKTVVLELTICKLIADSQDQNFKVVYQAPTKALCAERARDWTNKFRHINLECAELTGDTAQTELRRVAQASIIVTTPEKWDSVTRKWQDHRRLLGLVKLFLIDEVHILKDVRGATLEAVVSRMKTMNSGIRFVAMSATVPNSDDISEWLGQSDASRHLPARHEKFGEDLRPVKLQKHVYGYECGGNDFVFDKFLDQKLPMLLRKHAKGKPTIIFCFTRKSCESTAKMLAQWWTSMSPDDKPWKSPSSRIPVASGGLEELVKFGVAYHHAGLDPSDRNAVEQNFLKGELSLICCTSTLAVGINLPCSTVVIKGTFGFSENRLQELADLEVMQMLGRAGRPQFDDSATGIILTRNTTKARYERMVSGQETLESTLHINLIEHLNAEICLGTITNQVSAETWLKGSFLNVRLRKNPSHYRLAGELDDNQDNNSRNLLKSICERDIALLQAAEIVADDEKFTATIYGRAMSKYLIKFETMELLMSIPRASSLETLFITVCHAAEFSEIRMKSAERPLFRQLNSDPSIRFPIKEIPILGWHKVSLLLQATLGIVQYQDTKEASKLKWQLLAETKVVFELAQRIARCVIECKEFESDSISMKAALELARSAAAEAWEGRSSQLTQIPGFGPASVKRLAGRGVHTIRQLWERDYTGIENLMGRNPPFGKSTMVALERFPRFQLEAEIAYPKDVKSRGVDGKTAATVSVMLRYENTQYHTSWQRSPPKITLLAETNNGSLLYFWRGDIKAINPDHGRVQKFEALLALEDREVICYLSCEEIVGTAVSCALQLPVSDSTAEVPPSTAIRTNIPVINSMASGHTMDDSDSLDLEDEVGDQDLLDAAEAFQAPLFTALNRPGRDRAVRHLNNARQATSTGHGHCDLPASQSKSRGIQAIQELTRRHQPATMANGKWLCSHPCAGASLTRAGKPCTHRCCREGLDKPPKSDANKR